MIDWEFWSLIFFSFCMFVNGSLFIPQAIKILRRHSTEGLSLAMFLGFNVIQLSTVIHGYFQHDWALVVGMTYSLVTAGFVTCLIIYNRRSER